MAEQQAGGSVFGAPDIMSQAAQLQAAEAIRVQMEEYVRGRIRQFARDFAREVAPGMTPEAVDEAANRVILQGTGETAAALPPPAPAAPPAAAPALQAGQGQHRLVFRHECSALGCRDGECPLCSFNPVRVCERNFQKKYLVGDPLRAKCGSPIRVELLDTRGNLVTQGYPNLNFEVTLLDGVAYKDKGGESRLLSDDELRSCFKLVNHKDDPLLAYKTLAQGPSKGSGLAGGGGYGFGAAQQRHGSVQLRLEGGAAPLPDLAVTDSSEALLQGRRPPFRVLVWCPDALGGFDHSVQYAVSEDFVVATRRVKQANKADIPLVDDHVSKIEHIGRETVKKLLDMRGAALETGVDIYVDDRLARIETVGEFQDLVRCAEEDGQLRKAVQAILKLSKEKWEEAARHAMDAVHPDFRRRVWYPQGHNMGVGLVFTCKYGAVQLRDPISLAQTGPDGAVKVLSEDQLDPASLEIVRDLKTTAVKKWSEPRHQGWGIFQEPNGHLHGAPSAAAPAAARAALPAPAGARPAAAGARGGAGGLKRTASNAGLPADRAGSAALRGPATSSVGAFGGAAALAPLPPLQLEQAPLGSLAGAAPAAGGAGWFAAGDAGSAALAQLSPEVLAALQAQLGLGALTAAAAVVAAGGPLPGADDAGAAPPAAGGSTEDTALVAAAAALMAAPPLAQDASPVPGLSPQVLQALQAQLAASAATGGGAGDLGAKLPALDAIAAAAAAAAGLNGTGANSTGVVAAAAADGANDDQQQEQQLRSAPPAAGFDPPTTGSAQGVGAHQVHLKADEGNHITAGDAQQQPAWAAEGVANLTNAGPAGIFGSSAAGGDGQLAAGAALATAAAAATVP